MDTYIWENPKWPSLTFSHTNILSEVERTALAEGQLMALFTALPLPHARKLQAEILTQELHQSWKLEGEELEEVRLYSSLTKRLKVHGEGLYPVAHIEGVVDVLMEAIAHAQEPLSHETLFSWHHRLFPQSLSGVFPVHSGAYRTDPIEVVSESMGKPKVWFTGPPAAQIPVMMEDFITWINRESKTMPAAVASAYAHLWFVTIHPFEDGNGRLGRILGDYMLSRNRKEGLTSVSSNSPILYSISTQIKKHQRDYYSQLHKAQTGNMDITEWVLWYLAMLQEAIKDVSMTIQATQRSARFFASIQDQELNVRQQKMLHALTHDFTGILTTQKWAKMTACSHDTAIRDIKDLIKRQILAVSSQRGRSTSYYLIW